MIRVSIGLVEKGSNGCDLCIYDLLYGLDVIYFARLCIFHLDAIEFIYIHSSHFIAIAFVKHALVFIYIRSYERFTS